ncbi:hypothetical protein [Ureibacillus sp. FSL W7-1570]|uniref:hypothetical protein n=1 Tax=Ureibacillus sp. FSL W7-1570 TaxID=2954593 RepID=UPI00315A559A
MNNQSIQSLLQQFALFKDLSDHEMMPIVNIAKSRQYQAGTHVFMQGILWQTFTLSKKE